MERDLSHVYWIGGSGCSGKSSIVRLLQKEQGFTAYDCDDHWGEHELRSNPVEHPGTIRIKANFEEYLRLAPAEFVEASRAWFREDFAMVLEDLDAMPSEKIVVEGVIITDESSTLSGNLDLVKQHFDL